MGGNPLTHEEDANKHIHSLIPLLRELKGEATQPSSISQQHQAHSAAFRCIPCQNLLEQLVYSVPNPDWGASVPPELMEGTKPNLTARPTLAFLLHLGREHLHFSSFAMQCFASIRHLHLHLKPGARANVHHLLPPGDVHTGI